MAVTTYNNPASPSTLLKALDFLNAYRQDFVATHSDWRKPENISLKMGVAGGEVQYDNLSDHPLISNLIMHEGSYNFTTDVWSVSGTELTARSSDTILSFVVDVNGCDGLLISIPYTSYINSSDPASQAIWNMVFYDESDDSILSTQPVTRIVSEGTVVPTATSIINDGTWNKIRIEMQIVSWSFLIGTNKINGEFDTVIVFNSGIIGQEDYYKTMPSVAPVIQTDNEIIATGSDTTPIDLGSFLNQGIIEHSWTYIPGGVGLLEGGSIYQLLISNPGLFLQTPDEWNSITEGEGLNLFLGENGVTVPVCEVLSVDDDTNAINYGDSYNALRGSKYRINLLEDFDNGADVSTAEFGTGIYRSYLRPVTDSQMFYFALPTGTYGFSFRVRVPGYYIGEVATFNTQYFGMSVRDSSDAILYRDFYTPAEGDVYTNSIESGTFIIPADGLYSISIEISVNNAGGDNADKAPLFDNIIIWDNSKTSPVDYNSGINHPISFVLEVDETDTVNNYEYVSEWILSGNQSPFALIESSDATFPAPAEPTDSLDTINWDCNCNNQITLMKRLLEAAQPFIDDYSDLGVKTVQVQSDSRPSDALIISKGVLEGIDVLNDDNVQILWVDSSFEYVGKFVVYNSEIILINELSGGYGTISVHTFEIAGDRLEATITIDTFGKNFIPVFHVNGHAIAGISVWFEQTDPDGLSTYLRQWSNWERIAADGLYDITIDTAPDMIESDYVNPIVQDRELSEYTFTVTILNVTEAGGFPGVGREDGTGSLNSVTMELHYF